MYCVYATQQGNTQSDGGRPAHSEAVVQDVAQEKEYDEPHGQVLAILLLSTLLQERLSVVWREPPVVA
jgi:hypothetical protein